MVSFSDWNSCTMLHSFESINAEKFSEFETRLLRRLLLNRISNISRRENLVSCLNIMLDGVAKSHSLRTPPENVASKLSKIIFHSLFLDECLTLEKMKKKFPAGITRVGNYFFHRTPFCHTAKNLC